jgi:photosystem II stability/assembly factor-like uncharacterized protein
MKIRSRKLFAIIGLTGVLATAILALSMAGLVSIPGIMQNDPLKYYIKKGPVPRQTYQALQRVGFNGRFDYKAHDIARNQSESLRANAFAKVLKEGPDSTNMWQLRGPINSGGRITDIAGTANSPDQFYVGTASGGVFKTIDGGSTFVPIFDQIGTLAIGGLALHPENPDVLYVGTGEANPGGGSVAYPGSGVYKTSDGGSTWQHLGLEKTRYIGRLVIDRQNPERIFVAAMGELFTENPERGLYLSEDGGTTWKEVLKVSARVGVVDVVIDPVNSSRMFAATWERQREPSSRDYGGPNSAVWRSLDSGNTWTRLATGLPTGDQGRIGLAIAPSSPDTVYAIYADKIGYFKGLYRSLDGGDNFQSMSGSGLSGFYSSFGWWFGRVWVHPTNAEQVWAAGVSLQMSTDGGSSFTQRANNTHADHHALWFAPSDPSIVLLGNDGGLFKSTDGGSSFRELPLPVTQFYAIEASEDGQIIGGFQDNGTRQTPSGRANEWRGIYGGDGMTPLIDPNSRSTIYAGSQYGNIVKSTDNGTSFRSAISGASGRFNWHTPITIDPASAGTGSTTLYMGSHRLFRSTNNAASWTAISGDLTGGDQGRNDVTFGTITTIAVAPSERNTIYVGTDDGRLWVTVDYGRNFRAINAGLPAHWVTRVTVDPKNDAVVYVTFSGFREAQSSAHVFRSEDHGGRWINISAGLPPTPVNDLVVNPVNQDHLYVATDAGVFVSKDEGQTWQTLGANLPAGLVVNDLKIVGTTTRTLFAGTFGRGAWSIVIE